VRTEIGDRPGQIDLFCPVGALRSRRKPATHHIVQQTHTPADERPRFAEKPRTRRARAEHTVVSGELG
jgi:hypothetical protein